MQDTEQEERDEQVLTFYKCQNLSLQNQIDQVKENITESTRLKNENAAITGQNEQLELGMRRLE